MPPKSSTVSPLAQIKEIENDPEVKRLIAEKLPPNYDFEIGKTIWRIRKGGFKAVALQFPEGLLIFSTRIGSILTQLTGVDVILMGDITYGACCVDDFTASMLGAELLVHYGHSCLVPTVVANKLDTIYVFVTISYNMDLASGSICKVIREEEQRQKQDQKQSKKIQYEIDPDEKGQGGGDLSRAKAKMRVCLVSTIQFAQSLDALKHELEKTLDSVTVEVPQAKPLSRGEILGCTAPKVEADLIIYVGDGRFHLEAMMMANRDVVAYRYDPYNTTTTNETFDHSALSLTRSAAISKVLRNCSSPSSSKRIGIILGTLGRQGNPKPMEFVYDKVKTAGLNPFVCLMSEVMPAKLELFQGVDGWVQFACPRLSIDWGECFSVPVMTSFEGIRVGEMMGEKGRCCGGGEKGEGGCLCYSHPMDYYTYDSLGGHTPNFGGGPVKKNRVVKVQM